MASAAHLVTVSVDSDSEDIFHDALSSPDVSAPRDIISASFTATSMVVLGHGDDDEACAHPLSQKQHSQHPHHLPVYKHSLNQQHVHHQDQQHERHTGDASHGANIGADMEDWELHQLVSEKKGSPLAHALQPPQLEPTRYLAFISSAPVAEVISPAAHPSALGGAGSSTSGKGTSATNHAGSRLYSSESNGGTGGMVDLMYATSARSPPIRTPPFGDEDDEGNGDRHSEGRDSSSSRADRDQKRADKAGSDDDRPEEQQRPLTAEEKEQVKERVLVLLAFYFGEDNYSKDQFLRKQAALDPLGQGWIGVDVIVSFKKMKKLTEDRELVMDALHACPLVVLNDDSTRLRRREVLVKDIEDNLAKTLILGNVPLTWTEDSVRALCTVHGTVMRVRFFTAGRDQPFTPAMKAVCMNEHGELRTGMRISPSRTYALVEYATIKQAGVAVKALQGEGSSNWRAGGVDACLLHRKPKAFGAAASSAHSPNGSHTSSREASPSSLSSATQRARAHSLNTRVARERSHTLEPFILSGPSASSTPLMHSQLSTHGHTVGSSSSSPISSGFGSAASLASSGVGSSAWPRLGSGGSITNVSATTTTTAAVAGAPGGTSYARVSSSSPPMRGQSGDQRSPAQVHIALPPVVLQRERSSSFSRSGVEERGRSRGLFGSNHGSNGSSGMPATLSPQMVRRLMDSEVGGPRLSAAAGASGGASGSHGITSLGASSSNGGSGVAGSGNNGNGVAESYASSASRSPTVHLSSSAARDRDASPSARLVPLRDRASSLSHTSTAASSYMSSILGSPPLSTTASNAPFSPLSTLASTSTHPHTSPPYPPVSKSASAPCAVPAASSSARDASANPPHQLSSPTTTTTTTGASWSAIASTSPRSSSMAAAASMTSSVVRQPVGPDGTRGFVRAM